MRHSLKFIPRNLTTSKRSLICGVGSFPFRHGLALLVAKPIANAAAAPPRTTRRGRSLHPRLRGALPPRLPLSVVRCGDPSARPFIHPALIGLLR